MKIGMIGAGSVAQVVGEAWVRAGHQVMLSSRHPQELTDVAPRLDAQAGTPQEAADFGEVVFLAVNYSFIDSAIDAIYPHVTGKLVIDATNPLVSAEGGGTERVIQEDQIAGELMQSRLPLARIGKAFTTLWTGHLMEQAFASPRIAMTHAANEPADRATIAKLIEATGFEPIDLGTLSDSRPLDPPSPIWNVVLTAEQAKARVADYRATL